MKHILFIVMIVLSFGLLLTACNNDSRSQLAKDEIYSCPMHPQVLKEKDGQCPMCNMDLEKRKATPVEMQKMQKEGNN